MVALLLSAWACGPQLERRVDAVDVHFAWRVDDGILTGELWAPTTGWVGVGFHHRPQLDGSVLLLGSARPDGSFEVVEHIAQPPGHSDRAAVGGRPGLLPRGRSPAPLGAQNPRVHRALSAILRKRSAGL